MKTIWISALLLLSLPAFSDTLYQADATSNIGVGVGVGYGVGVGVGVNAYPQGVYGAYTPAGVANGIPYDNFTYPYSTRCCGCNPCNNCGTSYSVR